MVNYKPLHLRQLSYLPLSVNYDGYRLPSTLTWMSKPGSYSLKLATLAIVRRLFLPIFKGNPHLEQTALILIVGKQVFQNET